MSIPSGGDAARPTRLLPWSSLGLLAVYWFGINAVWGAYEGFGQKQVELIVGRDSTGTVLAILELLGAIVAIVVQPTMGAISDHTPVPMPMPFRLPASSTSTADSPMPMPSVCSRIQSPIASAVPANTALQRIWD